MLKNLLFIIFSVLILNACNLSGNTDEEDFIFSPIFTLTIVDKNENALIGKHGEKYHPDSIAIRIPEQGDILENWFFACTGTANYIADIQYMGTKPHTKIDTTLYYIELSKTDTDTLELYHYYDEEEDFYYKMFIYNGVYFDEKDNQLNTNTGCGDDITYLIKNDL
ncbi:MAG: hypothetical protein ACQETL_09810 [Bacteroidota bacterium]